MSSLNRNKRSFPFSAPVFADNNQWDKEIGRAETSEEALVLYIEHYSSTGRSVVKAAKLSRRPGEIGPEYGWIPVFLSPAATQPG